MRGPTHRDAGLGPPPVYLHFHSLQRTAPWDEKTKAQKGGAPSTLLGAARARPSLQVLLLAHQARDSRVIGQKPFLLQMMNIQYPRVQIMGRVKTRLAPTQL